MKIKQIKKFEYDKIGYDELGLSLEQVHQFRKFLIDKGLSKALDFQLDNISTNSYVGIIKYDNIQLNILPKIIGENDSSCLENLSFMLSYTKQLKIHNTGLAELSKNNNPFLEILIAHYATSLLDALHKHIPHHYETKIDNLPTLKGRLLFTEHIRQNCSNQSHNLCQFDEFTPNNLLNQTLKLVAFILQKLTKVSETRNKLAKILAIYNDVNLKHISYPQAQKILLNRNQSIFKEPLDLAKLFLQHSTLSLHEYRFTNLAILFDMNRLFEEFIAQGLMQFFPGKVQVQARQTFIKDIAGIRHTSYVIKPDILFNTDTIIDTKYKCLDLPNQKPSETDIYQMLTYARFYNRENIILCYPVYKQSWPLTSIFKDNNCKISLLTIDLHKPLNTNYLKDIFYANFR